MTMDVLIHMVITDWVRPVKRYKTKFYFGCVMALLIYTRMYIIRIWSRVLLNGPAASGCISRKEKKWAGRYIIRVCCYLYIITPERRGNAMPIHPSTQLLVYTIVFFSYIHRCNRSSYSYRAKRIFIFYYSIFFIF
jgi:hypothetical protein